MILDGRAAQRESMTPAQQARRLRRCGRRVLDGLRLVEDDVVELVLDQSRRVAPERAVGRQHQVVVGQPGGVARLAGVIEDAQPGREARRLVGPVEDERSRHDRHRRAAAVAGGAPRLEQRQHHDGLAESHVVGEAPAEPELPQEREPAERVALIVAKLAAEGRRRIERAHAGELRQLGAGARELLVHPHRRLRLEQRVEQRGLRRAVAHVIAGSLAERRDPRVAAQPFLRHQPAGAIVQQHRRLAAAQGGEQLGDRGRPAVAEIDAAMELEPVDAGLDLHVEGSRGAERASFRLDVPAFLDQGTDRGRKSLDRDRQRRVAAVGVPRLVKAEAVEPLQQRPLGLRTAADQAPAIGIVAADLGAGGDDRTARSRTGSPHPAPRACRAPAAAPIAPSGSAAAAARRSRRSAGPRGGPPDRLATPPWSRPATVRRRPAESPGPSAAARRARRTRPRDRAARPGRRR